MHVCLHLLPGHGGEREELPGLWRVCPPAARGTQRSSCGFPRAAVGRCITAPCEQHEGTCGTSHRQNEYFKFHMAPCKLKPSRSRWRGWWYRESSLVGCSLSLWLPCTVTRQMLPSTRAVGLRGPLQLWFLEERLEEEEVQLLGAAFSSSSTIA